MSKLSFKVSMAAQKWLREPENVSFCAQIAFMFLGLFAFMIFLMCVLYFLETP